MATAPPQSPPSLNLCAILSLSKRIINAHSRHFLALAVLFLLPLSFSFTVFPTLQTLLADHFPNNSQIFISLDDHPHHHHRRQPQIPTKTLLLALAYAVFVFLFSLCAVGSITCSVFHGFFGRPVKLLSAVGSIIASFFPLLFTALIVQIIVAVISVIFALFVFLVISAIRLLGFQIEYSSPYFLGFCGALGIALLLVLVYLQVNWTLVSVIVVVEKSWGFESLRRSAGLIRGIRGTALSLLLFFGLFAALLAWCSSFSAMVLDDVSDGWRKLEFVVQIVVTSTFLTIVLLYNVAATAVLYMYCKAVHGELAMEIAEEFAREYVCLPFDEGKVPHVVSVAYA
ncbi:hypothetical protein L484_015715 [Morus notabilis]|uniref:Transmembrane protein n=1 Tax=Morus notabilis TaxID=981085 RepID=W9S0C6_9ROSA|nr:uncharacterized protein LOC21398798 [Morus notabilis]EXC20037.1 hypothetical protein L484_015715 [Morus notabilis]